MSSAMNVFQFPRLTKDNYGSWCMLLKALFGSHDVREIVEKGVEKVDDESSLSAAQRVELQKARKKDQNGLTLIYQCLDDAMFDKVTNAITSKERGRSFKMLSKVLIRIDLLTQDYKKFSISNKETIDSGFTQFNAIVTSLKSLDPDYSSKNHVRKFLRALPLKKRAKVAAIEEAKDLAKLPLDELIRNLKVNEMILASDGVASKPIKEKVMPIALKTNVTRVQTSNDSVCQDESKEDKDEEEELNSIVKNLWNKNHFVDDCPKGKMKNSFIGGARSNSKDGDQMEKDATYLMAIDSQKVSSRTSWHYISSIIFILPFAKVKSVGSSFSRVILIGSISVEVPVAAEVRVTVVASPTDVLELDTHSSSKADPSESSPPPVSVAPMVLPFLCFDNLESDTEIPERHVSPTTSTSEIPTTHILPVPSAIVAPSSEFPLAPVVVPLGIRRRRAILALTARKSIRPLPSHRLTLRSAPLSTMYPPTTSKSSAGDSYSKSSAGPSRKRCRSPAATMTSSIHFTRALVPSRADILPPHKRFRDSFTPEDSVEEDIDMDVLEDMRLMLLLLSDRGTMEVGVDMDAGIDILDGMLMPDAMERLEQVEEGLQNTHDHVIEIPLQRIEDIEIAQRQLEAGQLIASGESVGLSYRTRSVVLLA
uniref:DUF4219 domain-containing protein/UBN2 domain-containing protein n=1 Tax=Tanacetum cinerariifolium TaxID=118510 RepID=A0A6L2LG64_TANCI|nr:hypothetical protein [Tanacetum cinerariifolium]